MRTAVFLNTVAAPPATVSTTSTQVVSTFPPNAHCHWPLQFACAHTMHKRFPTFQLWHSCTRGSTSARSAVLLLQQIREQLGVTQLRDVAHSLRRGEGGRVRVRQTALLSRRNAAHTRLQALQLAPVPVGADHHQRRARRDNRQRVRLFTRARCEEMPFSVAPRRSTRESTVAPPA